MKRILLAVSGMSPQIITEALYCLHCDGRDVDAIHVVTTRDGKDLLQAGLLDSGRGQFYRFCKEYGLDARQVDFSRDNMHIPLDARGRELPDIVDQDDNEALLVLCLRLARELTQGDTAVYFLVAGGRKTMSSCLSFAAQMYGRPQDRIYHVLVSPEFESHRDFWFPPREARRLELRDRQGRSFWMNTDDARVQLVSLPFLSLRRHLPGHLLAGPDTPGALMASLVREEDRGFTISLAAKTVAYGSLQVDLKPVWLALLAFFAEIRLQGAAPVPTDSGECPPWFLETGEILNRQNRIVKLYEHIAGGRKEGMSTTGISSLNADNFHSYRSRVNQALRTAFGPAGELLAIQPWGRRPNTRYGLRIEKRQVQLQEK